jgi:hypothetical protein
MADARGMEEDAMQLDLVEWIADQDGTAGASSPPGSGARVHDEHGPLSALTARDAPCVHIEHTADARPVRPMSPHRLLVCLAVLGWSERELARRTGRHQTTIRRWTGGSGAVDGDTATWLERLVEFHAAHPAPRRRAGLPACC